MAKLAPYGPFRALDGDGNPLSGGKLYTYEAGTTTEKDTYTTADGDIANANPVILDANGYADVWLGSGSYKFVLKTSADVDVWTIDDILGDTTTGFGGSTTTTAANLNVTSVYNKTYIECTDTLTLSLLDVATAEDGFYFIVNNTGSGTVTIDPDSSEQVDGASTASIAASSSAIVRCNGTSWNVLFNATVASDKNNSFTGNNSFAGKTAFKDDGELTVSSGAITITGTKHTVDTESDAASDDLETINGGADGQFLIISPANDARTVVLKSTGNIDIANDITLDDSNLSAVLIYDNTLSKWIVLSKPTTFADASDIVTGTATDKSVTPAHLDFITLSTTTASNDADVSFDIDFSKFPTQRIEFSGVTPATDGSGFNLQYSANGGSSYKTGSYQYASITNNTNATTPTGTGGFGQTNINIAPAVGNAAGESCYGFLEIRQTTSDYCHVSGIVTSINGSGFLVNYRVSGSWGADTDSIDNVRLLMGSGNITSGTFIHKGSR